MKEFLIFTFNAVVGKSGDIDHPYPVQIDHLKLTSFSCIKKVAIEY